MAERSRQLSRLLAVKELLRLGAARHLADANDAQERRCIQEAEDAAQHDAALVHWLEALSARSIAPVLVDAWARETDQRERKRRESARLTGAAVDACALRHSELAYADGAKRVIKTALKRAIRRETRKVDERGSLALGDTITFRWSQG